MRHLSAIVLILILTVSPACDFLRHKGIIGKKARTLESLRAQQDSIRVADSIRKVQDDLLALENAKLDSVRQEEAKRLAVAQTSKYNIIVGSFLTPVYAQGLSETYREQGFDTKVFKMEGSDFELVSAESHTSLRKAIERLQQFQDTVEIDSWIYIRP